MPTPQEFMEQVVAWPGVDGPGYVNLHWLPPEARGHGLRGKPFKEVHEFMQMAQYATTKPGIYKEIYYCLSTQSAMGKVIHGHATAARSKPTAIRLKSIWIDVDVKPDKGYATLTEALDGINQFYRAAQLPPPSALVLSGGGVHVYWISDKPLTKEEWRPYAEGLKAEILRLGLKCDAGLTTDEARILRVPGTFNNKTFPARTVRLAHLGRAYAFDPTLSRLATLVPRSAPVTVAVTSGQRALIPFDLTVFQGQKMLPILAAGLPDPAYDSLAEGIGLYSDMPLDPAEVFKGCVHYLDAAMTHGAKHTEPLWNVTLLGSTWFEDGRRWGHFLSKGHPGYIKEETDKKFDDKLMRVANGTGWPSCQAFEDAGAKCKTCPFYKKLRSPLNLAQRVQPPSIVAQPAPPPPDDLNLPAGYTVDPETGCIAEIVNKTLPNGVAIQELAQLFYSEIKDPIAQRGYRKFMFKTSLDGGSWGDVTILETDLATEQSLVIALRKHGVKPYPRHQSKLVQFMTAWMDKLDKASRRIETTPFGWLRAEEGGEVPVGFAYGGRVIMAGGKVQVAGFSDAQIEAMYKPKGREQAWWDAFRIVTEQNRPDLEAMIAMSFAAPLMYATGHYNSVMCAWSPRSGGHKTTSMHIGAAVWGCPQLCKERPISTQKGIIRKLGHLQSLPVFWDEISDDAKMDEVREILGWVTEGGGGSRLKQNRDLYEVERWQTLMMIGANRSLVENIIRNVNGTDAQLQRVFEFQVDKRPDTRREEDVTPMIEALDYNYGHLGLKYQGLIAQDPAGIKQWVNGMLHKFNDEVQHVSEERFRSAMAVTIYCGATLANQIGCDFHLPELWEFLKLQYLNQRESTDTADVIAGSPSHTANMLAQFFKFCVHNTLWVQHMPVMRKGHPDAIAYVAGPNSQRVAQVHIRCSINDRIIDLSKRHLMKFLVEEKSAPATVMKALSTHYGATFEPKVDLSVGSEVGGGREPILRVPVPPGSVFENFLYRRLPISERPVATEDEPLPRFDSISPPISELPQRGAPSATDIIERATAQAARDLDHVRKNT